MTSERRWHSALAQHRAAVDAFVALIDQLPESAWQREPEPGKWSPATLTLHLTDAYVMGARAVTGGSSMKLRIPRWRAWMYRTFLLPRLLRRGQFPTVRAPREIQPDLDLARSLARPDAIAALRRKSAEAAEALQVAERTPSASRMTHAYFGELAPYLALRFLTCHTQHHTRQLARRGSPTA